jgi:hypothetical protein
MLTPQRGRKGGGLSFNSALIPNGIHRDRPTHLWIGLHRLFFLQGAGLYLQVAQPRAISRRRASTKVIFGWAYGFGKGGTVTDQGEHGGVFLYRMINSPRASVVRPTCASRSEISGGAPR